MPKIKKILDEMAKRIRNARKTAGLSQNELGNFVGVSDKSISAYEQGRSVPPLGKLKKIAQWTSFPLSYFTQEDNIDAQIASKLTSIEEELAEVKTLFQSRKTY